MELTEIRRGGTGIWRRVRAELHRAPIRPRIAELVDTSRIAAHTIEGVGHVTGARRYRSRPLRERSQPLRGIRARPDDVRLVIEHEDVGRGPLLGVGCRLVHLDRADLEKW